MLDGSLNVAVSPFEPDSHQKEILPQVTSSNWNSLLSCNSINTPSTLTMGSQGFSFVVGPCGGHARKDGRTGFSSAAPAAASTFTMAARSASTFKMAVQGSQELRLPRFNLLDGRTGFSSAAPVTQTNGICKIIVSNKEPN